MAVFCNSSNCEDKALDNIIALIEDQQLSRDKANSHRKKYIALLEGCRREDWYQPTIAHYLYYLTCLMELEKYSKMRRIWETTEPQYKTEDVFRKMLEMYYMLGDKTRFFKTLDEMKQSKLNLSSEGVDLLSFWENNPIC